MNVLSWNKETRQAYVGTMLYSILGIVAAILTPIATLGAVAGVASKMAGGSAGVGGGLGLLLILVNIAILAGYVIFFLAVKDLKTITEGNDQEAFKKIFTSVVLDIIAVFLRIFHLGFISGILSLISCILLVIAYSSLKGSMTLSKFSPAASEGFKKLFTAEILVIVAVVIGWIPVIGGLVGAILKVIAWILVLLGWKKISTPVLAEGEEKASEKTVKEVIVESVEEAKEVAKDAAKASKIVVEEIENKAKEAGSNIKERLSEDKKEE